MKIKTYHDDYQFMESVETMNEILSDFKKSLQADGGDL